MNQPRDALLQRYDEANQQDASRPPAQLRAAILAHASQLAATRDTGVKVVEQPQREAANASRWQITMLGGLAALGFVGLLFIEFYQGDAQEREVAFGTGRPPLTQQSSPPTVATTPATGTAPPLPPAVAPVTVRPSTPQPSGEAVSDGRTAQSLPSSPAAVAIPAPVPAPVPSPAPAAKMAADAAREHGAASQVSRELAAGALAASGSRPAAPAMLAETRRATAAAGVADGTTLLQAAQAGDLARVNVLLGQAVALDLRDDAGRTPLMLAVLHGREAVVRRLLAAGANTAAVDRDGKTALQLAQTLGSNDMAALLEAARPQRP